jgi:hypothetical protein
MSLARRTRWVATIVGRTTWFVARHITGKPFAPEALS